MAVGRVATHPACATAGIPGSPEPPVVVTGSAGFIGRHLVTALTARGRHVLGIDRRPQRPAPLFTPLPHDLLDDSPRLRAALGGAAAVYHLAACPGVRSDGPDIHARRQRDNVLATERVLGLVPWHTPLLVSSSSSVYGGSRGRPSRETDPPAPRGGYARSKVAVESLCAARRAAGGHVTVVRPFTVVGPGQRPDMVVSRWLDAALSDRPLPVLGGLERTRDFTDVRDVVRAFIDLLDGRVDGIVNVGTGRPQALARLVQAIADVVGRELATVVVPAQRQEPPHTCADTTTLQAAVGWTPSTDLTDVVAAHLRDRDEVTLSA